MTMSTPIVYCQDCQRPCGPHDWRFELTSPTYFCASCWAWYQIDRCVFVCDRCQQRQPHELCHTCRQVCRVENWLQNKDYIAAVPFRRRCHQCDVVFREFIPPFQGRSDQ